MDRPANLLKLVIAAETWNYPPLHRLPRREANGLINGIFADVAEREAYQRGLVEQSTAPAIDIDENGYPELPAYLDRRARP